MKQSASKLDLLSGKTNLKKLSKEHLLVLKGGNGNENTPPPPPPPDPTIGTTDIVDF